MDNAHKLEYGVWLKGTDLSTIADVSFDYVEMEFRTIASMDVDKFHILFNYLQERAIKVKSMNCFIPKRYSILAPNFRKDITPYLKEGFIRANSLGTRYVVFGSPKSRQRTSETSAEDFENILIDTLIFICNIADQYDIKIVLEPICLNESNTINTIQEADYIAQKMNYKIGTLCDLYHMKNMGEDKLELHGYNSLCHCHIMNPFTRNCPKQEDSYNYFHFMKNIVCAKRIKSMTIEVPTNICYLELNRSLEFLKSLEMACLNCFKEAKI